MRRMRMFSERRNNTTEHFKTQKKKSFHLSHHSECQPVQIWMDFCVQRRQCGGGDDDKNDEYFSSAWEAKDDHFSNETRLKFIRYNPHTHTHITTAKTNLYWMLLTAERINYFLPALFQPQNVYHIWQRHIMNVIRALNRCEPNSRCWIGNWGSVFFILLSCVTLTIYSSKLQASSNTRKQNGIDRMIIGLFWKYPWYFIRFNNLHFDNT